ncbi:hypothetical protein BJG93_18165 [Paraburkholderia sprentiae WSM5005]|uniref:Uncharacterized protein n=1 Tax=Paraburkholderia sprentiae WSM5005 TaxID=754502 RepID=A0A1I9YM98_9BURK|nr:hypothetical protein [Paraburkholderia sprentiae]APA87431.2 hypothetical protein BJG93_18165 [Paraburkholderia sprentiae WSM5005]
MVFPFRRFTFCDALIHDAFYHSLTGKLGRIVHSTYLAERFFGGVTLGVLVGWFVSAGVDHWKLTFSIGHGFALRLALKAVASACLLLPRPLLLKTVLRSRRSVFTRDEHVRAMLMGRVVGLVGGIWVGATVNSLLA